MDEAAIDQFVDQLVDAGQFVGAGTAVATRTGPLLRAASARRFSNWLMIALAAAGEQCPAQEEMTGIAVIQDDGRTRCIQQDHDEAGAEFVRRIAREAAAVRQPWLLVCLRDTRDTLWWYAEARGRGVAQARVGRMGADSDTDAFTGEPIHPSDAHSLGRILHGHPARRRFPLRRANA